MAKKPSGTDRVRETILAVNALRNSWMNWHAIERWMQERQEATTRFQKLLGTVCKLVNDGQCPFSEMQTFMAEGPRFSSTLEFMNLVVAIPGGIAKTTTELESLIRVGGMDALNQPGGVTETREVLQRLKGTRWIANELRSLIDLERGDNGRVQFDLDSDVRKLAQDGRWYSELDLRFQAALEIPAPTPKRPRAVTSAEIHKAVVAVDKRGKLLDALVSRGATTDEIYTEMKAAGFPQSRATFARWASPFRKARERQSVSFGETDPEKFSYRKRPKKTGH
ncbi:MAG: hypothetical protein J0L78_00540 [Planctomycetes bacterium]|nr:hypothetical protein [Planctomycetota bacterium]